MSRAVRTDVLWVEEDPGPVWPVGPVHLFVSRQFRLLRKNVSVHMPSKVTMDILIHPTLCHAVARCRCVDKIVCTEFQVDSKGISG